MIFFVLFLIALALVAQRLLSRDSLHHVREELHPEENVAEPGQTFFLNISLKNTGRRYLPFLKATLYLPKELQPQDTSHCQRDRERGGCTVTYSAWLRPHQQAEFRLPVVIDHRGRYVLNHLAVYGGDFLGLSEQVRRLERFNEVIIAPKEAPEPEVLASLGGFLGEISVNRFLHEDPVLTVGFREYTGREPMKMISWTQSAKGRGLMVKNYDYTIEPTVSVLICIRESVSKDALEGCWSLARTVCRLLEERRIPYELSTNAALAGGWEDGELTIRQGLGAGHFSKVLELLGRATSATMVSGESFLQRATGDGTVCSRILIIPQDDFLEPEPLSRLKEQSGGSLLVLTPDEMTEKEANPLCSS